MKTVLEPFFSLLVKELAKPNPQNEAERKTHGLYRTLAFPNNLVFKEWRRGAAREGPSRGGGYIEEERACIAVASTGRNVKLAEDKANIV